MGSQGWSNGYTSHTQYTYGYFREMAPAHLRFCLLAAGILPPPETGFRACELAMGQGLSANIHAVANACSYAGMDLNPDHAAFASRLAELGKTGLAVSDADLAAYCEEDHEPFDLVCLHGGWTWISAASREMVVRFLQKFLKPGGLFYISYNTWPGWSVTAPLRELFRLFDCKYGADGLPGAARVRNAVALTGEMLAAGPLFCNASPWIAETFEQLRQQPEAYLDHEFFNADWAVMYFREVAETLGQARLRFAASAQAQDNLGDFGLTGSARAFMARIETPEVWQQARDFFCNTRYRADIFVRGAVRLAPEEQERLFLESRFALVMPARAVELELDCGMGRFRLDAASHGQLLELLADNSYQPKSGAELLDGMGGKMTPESLLAALCRLVGLGCVHPCQARDAAGQRTKACQECARVMVENETIAELAGFLPSPQTGGGLALNRLDRLFVRETIADRARAGMAGQDNGQAGADIGSIATRIVRSRPENFFSQMPENDDALAESVATAYGHFQTRLLPVLEALGTIRV